MYALSSVGARDLKNEEGLCLRAYVCAAGKLTIGYGHRLYGAMSNIVCTLQQAEEWFTEDTGRVLQELWIEIKTLDQNEVDALVSFIFNIGINAWRGSTARIDLLKGDYARVPIEMRRWIHDDHGNVIPGLVARHNKEADLFTGSKAA